MLRGFCRVLGESSVTHLLQTEDILGDVKPILDLGSHAGLKPLQLHGDSAQGVFG